MKRKSKAEITLRRPNIADGSEMWRVVRESGVLEANSCYAYLLLCEHFADTCVAAQWGDEVVGFVTAYVPPTRPDVIFVWQIAVAAAARKQGLAGQMLRHLLSLPTCQSVRFLEATVSPSNRPSRRLFESLARNLGVPCQVVPGFQESDFRYQEHEEEQLFRIGPLKGITRS